MIQLSLKMMSHHSVMIPSLRIKNRNDTFCDFSSDIDCDSKTHVFSEVIYLIINHCEPRSPKGATAHTKCPPAAHN